MTNGDAVADATWRWMNDASRMGHGAVTWRASCRRSPFFY
jgi:hypothetical protein